ncbi:cytochrome c oxidase subunit II [Paracoccus sp. S-4012]|nr:cytochrome c oxidase subunit II [Paracoccus sp. S-4012]MRX49917.1 cytochrome c oxidase subunit II [Paracoccus sp. S-4012]
MFLVMVVFSGFIVLLVATLVIVFSIRFRSGSRANRHEVRRLVSREVEIAWTAATAFGAMFFFWFASAHFLRHAAAPVDAMEVHVEAKQWMWKATHESGARELGSLHVPLGRATILYMNSQDVIHSFFVPAFRLKQDVVPGMTTTMWFTPTRTGSFHLFCAEYCGTGHSTMLGEIVVMDEAAFAAWLEARPGSGSLVDAGRVLFTEAGCASCHDPASAVHAPDLRGIYGRPVPLADGRIVTADAAYLQDSILQPDRDVVAGFDPIMPNFSGLLDEDEVAGLVAWLRTLERDDG